MLNKDVLVCDPASYRLADGGVAKVSFPPEDDEQRAILREQLDTFVCEGAYAEALRRILDTFNAAAGRRGDVPAAWISGFYGSGKSLLAAMLGALWTNIEFDDGATAEGLVHNMPSEVKAALRELRGNIRRLGHSIVGGSTLGRGSQHPVKAVLEVILRAAGLPSGNDLRPSLVALWLNDQGTLADVRASLGDDFDQAAREFLLDERLAAAALTVKPDLAASVDMLMDRLNRQFEHEPEPTVELLVEMAQKALMVGRKEMPLTLVILDEVQQFIREDADTSLLIQTIAEELCSRFRGRVFLVATGQSALGDVKYLEKLLTRFSIPISLGAADINSVIRQTVLLKSEVQKPDVEKLLGLRSGEIDRHLQGSSLQHAAADRQYDVADWPILATRRRVWERVLAELDKSGLGATLRGQLRICLDAVKQYGDKPLGFAVPGNFLYDTFAAEALSRNLISREIADKIAILRAQPGDGPLKARLLILVYLVGRIVGDVDIHGVHSTPEMLADLLIEDLGDGASVRAKVPQLLAGLQDESAVIEVAGEWRLQTKESAEWLTAFNRAQAQEVADVNGTARQRASLLELAIDGALAGAGQVMQGASKTPRRIERVAGDAKPNGDGLVLRLWNGWEHSLTATVTEIRAADVNKDSTLHLIVPDHRRDDLRNAIATLRAATSTIQTQGVPTTDGGKEAKAAMESRRDSAKRSAEEILAEAVAKAQVLVAGGAEVGIGLSRADALKDAATRVLDRLYPEFLVADHAGWDRVDAQARKRVPDAMKEVGHTGEPQDHPVCKAFLRALTPAKRGSDLRNVFAAPQYGWPKEAVDAVMRVLANAGQVKVAGPDGKAVIAADLTATQLGTCIFAPEVRVVSTAEKVAVRALGLAVGLTIPSGDELNYLLPIVDRLEQIANDAGGEAPAPTPPDVPGMADFRSLTGNDLLAALADRQTELRSLIPTWQAAKTEKETRLRTWTLANRLVSLGAIEQRAAVETIRTGRKLLSEPDPLPALVSAATDDLRAKTNAAHAAWKAAWDAGEVRLKADRENRAA
jgi:hypothetical protein